MNNKKFIDDVQFLSQHEELRESINDYLFNFFAKTNDVSINDHVPEYWDLELEISYFISKRYP